VLEGWTAVMIEDYADRPGWRGEPLFEPARFAAIATEIDRRGLQIAVHAIGDGGVRITLDAYAAARAANGPRDSRHRVEHIESLHPDDIPRFAEMGVIASMQPLHRPDGPPLPGDPIRDRLGPARWPSAYATDTLRRAGARVAFASDWPVSPIDPMLSIRAATVRTPWAAALPAQASTLHEAVAHYTRDAAFAEFAEGRKGAITPGFLADLVVLSADLEATAPDALDEARPVATVCGGRVVWQA
jgi:predicted amidohydrolase YtcJ